MMKQLLLLSSILITSALADEKQWFVDKNLVYEQGSVLSLDYLKEHAPKLIEAQKQVLPWVVRIEAQHSFTKNGFTSNHGTGIILKNGLVVTAHHIFTKNIPKENEKLKILLTLTDGQVFPATLDQHGKSDWALLKIDLKQKKRPDCLVSPITMADPQPDETTIFLGYPARLGLDKNGKVQSFHKGNKKKNIPTSQLYPMLVVASVSDPKQMSLKPLAGFPAVGGMSGGPILNEQGQVIAMQHGITKTTDNATGKVLNYRLDATPSGDVGGR